MSISRKPQSFVHNKLLYAVRDMYLSFLYRKKMFEDYMWLNKKRKQESPKFSAKFG